LRSALGSPLDGVLTRYARFDEAGLVQPPDYLSDIEAACLPCAAVTAWNALCSHGVVASGQTVLLLGTGAVSLFALGIARSLGARVLITSKSDAKLERARALGADATLNRQSFPAFDDWARSLTDGEGVDCVVDVAGGPALPTCVRAVRPGGTVAMVGVLAGSEAALDVRPIIMRQVRLQGVFVGSRASFEALNTHLSTTHIVPVVARVYPFADVHEAFRDCARAEHFGKICIKLED
jgi:NADPH:quinone reductase-like Zn-dependent oxidoreductase